MQTDDFASPNIITSYTIELQDYGGGGESLRKPHEGDLVLLFAM